MRQEISRLRSLVSRAASDLMNAGAERKAGRLVRALGGRHFRTQATMQASKTPTRA
jgi:hypothetical protein